MTIQLSRLLFAGIAVCAAANASSIFTFDGDPVGTATGFTDTVNGLSATFSSSADPGAFVVYASMFNTLTGNVLGDPGPAGLDNLALDIAFSSNLNSATLDFATSDFQTASPLTITAYEGSTLVGSASSIGSFIPGFSFPEGQVSFTGGVFNNLVVSSTATDFAVDNISATSAPEPGALSLLALGLVGIVSPRLYSKFKQRTASH